MAVNGLNTYNRFYTDLDAIRQALWCNGVIKTCMHRRTNDRVPPTFSFLPSLLSHAVRIGYSCFSLTPIPKTFPCLHICSQISPHFIFGLFLISPVFFTISSFIVLSTYQPTNRLKLFSHVFPSKLAFLHSFLVLSYLITPHIIHILTFSFLRLSFFVSIFSL